MKLGIITEHLVPNNWWEVKWIMAVETIPLLHCQWSCSACLLRFYYNSFIITYFTSIIFPLLLLILLDIFFLFTFELHQLVLHFRFFFPPFTLISGLLLLFISVLALAFLCRFLFLCFFAHFLILFLFLGTVVSPISFEHLFCQLDIDLDLLQLSLSLYMSLFLFLPLTVCLCAFYLFTQARHTHTHTYIQYKDSKQLLESKV